jgi:hypothetical protein
VGWTLLSVAFGLALGVAFALDVALALPVAFALFQFARSSNSAAKVEPLAARPKPHGEDFLRRVRAGLI